MRAIGIDIGTTTICAIIVDVQNGTVIKTVTEKNDCQITGRFPFEYLQDPAKILNKAESLVRQLTESYAPISCIGVTGQMHGIVYLNKFGNAISPLYTWQDESANQLCRDGATYAQILSSKTGYPMSTGFGFSTLFFHTQNKMVPAEAAYICTIHDYVAMKLAGRVKPVLHPSDAASFGCYQLSSQSFDTDALSRAGLDTALLPEIASDKIILGEFNHIPISLAIGDNQASYIGSVCNMKDCLLVNIGTGSQVSFPVVSGTIQLPREIERRPCTDRQAIAVGSSLCGGRAFAALEQFFRQTAEMVSGETFHSAYPGMDRMLNEISTLDTDLSISTKFCGTRICPDERGMICGLSLSNFTPRDFMLATLRGITAELFDMYRSAEDRLHIECRNLIGSGNGLRQNPALQKMFEHTFGMTLKIPRHKEEAAFGAILFALAASGIYPTIEEAQSLICYQ